MPSVKTDVFDRAGLPSFWLKGFVMWVQCGSLLPGFGSCFVLWRQIQIMTRVALTSIGYAVFARVPETHAGNKKIDGIPNNSTWF